MPTSPRQPDRHRHPVPVDVSSVGAARRFATAALEGWGRDELVDTVALLVSEVVTNVVLHAGTPGELVIERRDGGVRIEVHDGAGQMPRRKSYGDEASTGRGLALVELLADDWGADPTGTGKCVWFEVVTPSLVHDAEPVPAIDIIDAPAPAAPGRRPGGRGSAGGPRRPRSGPAALRSATLILHRPGRPSAGRDGERPTAGGGGARRRRHGSGPARGAEAAATAAWP